MKSARVESQKQVQQGAVTIEEEEACRVRVTFDNSNSWYTAKTLRYSLTVGAPRRVQKTTIDTSQVEDLALKLAKEANIEEGNEKKEEKKDVKEEN